MKCLRCGQEHAIQSSTCPRCGFPNPLANSTDKDMGSASTLSHAFASPPSPSQARRPTGQSASEEERTSPSEISVGQQRYQLRHKLERLDWYQNAYEDRWLAQERDGGQVLVSEVMLPILQVKERQLALPNMLSVANAASRHTHLPKLLQVFREQGRDFFVFQWLQTETVYDRVKRIGRPLPEQDLIQFCLSILNEAIAPFALQNPPIVHGLISPKHIFLTRDNWFLSNCSLILASQQFRSTANPAWTIQSSYLPPEIGTTSMTLDGRIDIYAVLAVAYFALTGTDPQDMASKRITPVRQKNPFVSEPLERILAKGLDPWPERRYQSVSELQYDLQTLTTVSPLTSRYEITQRSQGGPPVTRAETLDSFDRNIPNRDIPNRDIQTDRKRPSPGVAQLPQEQAEDQFEELHNLPAFIVGNDTLGALWWILGILSIALLISAFR